RGPGQALPRQRARGRRVEARAALGAAGAVRARVLLDLRRAVARRNRADRQRRVVDALPVRRNAVARVVAGAAARAGRAAAGAVLALRGADLAGPADVAAGAAGAAGVELVAGLTDAVRAAAGARG